MWIALRLKEFHAASIPCRRIMTELGVDGQDPFAINVAAAAFSGSV
jgi:hypothetical protein